MANNMVVKREKTSYSTNTSPPTEAINDPAVLNGPKVFECLTAHVTAQVSRNYDILPRVHINHLGSHQSLKYMGIKSPRRYKLCIPPHSYAV
jgi:hypothetical protein